MTQNPKTTQAPKKTTPRDARDRWTEKNAERGHRPGYADTAVDPQKLNQRRDRTR
jgi:hypothetical protein